MELPTNFDREPLEHILCDSELDVEGITALPDWLSGSSPTSLARMLPRLGDARALLREMPASSLRRLFEAVLERMSADEAAQVLQAVPAECLADLRCAWPLYHRKKLARIVAAAVEQGLSNGVLIACRLGADPTEVIHLGAAALHMAAMRNDADVIRALSAAGASLDQESDWGRPLHVAAMFRSAEAFLALSDCGADMLATDHEGCTAAHVAARLGRVEILTICAERMDLNTRDARGRTPLHHAVEYGCEKTVCLLLSLDVDVAAPDLSGRTPADLASGKRASLRQLIPFGA